MSDNIFETLNFENLVRDVVVSEVERKIRYALDSLAVRYSTLTVNADVKVELSEDSIKEVIDSLLSNPNIRTLDEVIRSKVGSLIYSITRECYNVVEDSLRHAEMLMKKGFVIKNGRLVYEDTIYAKKITDGNVTFDLDGEYEEKYYVSNITVSILPFRVEADGYHPHLRGNNYCTGSVENIRQFIDAFPGIFEVIYVHSMQPDFDELKELGKYFIKRKGEKEGWGGEW